MKKTKKAIKEEEIKKRLDLIKRMGIKVGLKCRYGEIQGEIKRITKNGLIKMTGVRELLLPSDFFSF
jgi:hypothetical protein